MQNRNAAGQMNQNSVAREPEWLITRCADGRIASQLKDRPEPFEAAASISTRNPSPQYSLRRRAAGPFCRGRRVRLGTLCHRRIVRFCRHRLEKRTAPSSKAQHQGRMVPEDAWRPARGSGFNEAAWRLGARNPSYRDRPRIVGGLDCCALFNDFFRRSLM